MSDSSEIDSSQALSPDDALPPVQPPNATFIVQLFVVPAVIVLAVVAVTLLFKFLSYQDSDPTTYVEEIAKGRLNSWQAAHDLAIRVSQDSQLRVNHDLSARLATLLQDRMEAKVPPGGKGVRERMERESYFHLLLYLTKLQGEFQVSDGALALLEAAQLTRAEEDLEIRKAALESLAALCSNNSDSQFASRQDILSVLLNSSRDEEHSIRERAAFALGVFKADEAHQRLVFLLTDAYPNVRFNAATALCRGENSAEVNSEVTEVLREMLDPDEKAALADEESEEEKQAKQALVINVALVATEKLFDNNPDLDQSALRGAVNGVVEAAQEGKLPPGVTQSIKMRAKRLLRSLSESEASKQASST